MCALLPSHSLMIVLLILWLLLPGRLSETPVSVVNVRSVNRLTSASCAPIVDEPRWYTVWPTFDVWSRDESCRALIQDTIGPLRYLSIWQLAIRPCNRPCCNLHIHSTKMFTSTRWLALLPIRAGTCRDGRIDGVDATGRDPDVVQPARSPKEDGHRLGSSAPCPWWLC